MHDGELLEALATSQRLGMLGARPLTEVVDHAAAYVDALDEVRGTVVDLGAGGGVPGLVIAVARPDLRLVLVDRRVARADHLERLVRRLELQERVTVMAMDAQAVQLDAPADAVVARGFGSPTATAAAAAPLLRPGGLLVVSEPPAGDADRWSAVRIGDAGLRRVPHDDRRVAVLRRVPRGTA